VARADNNVWVPALARDTAFAAWLDASGLTRNPAYAAGAILTVGGAGVAVTVPF
jgi:hypothetical protein